MGHKHDGGSLRTKEFLKELKQKYPNYRVTSHKRKGDPNSSTHNAGDGIDFAPDKGLKDFLTSNEGIALMHKYGLGFVHEFNANDKRKNPNLDHHRTFGTTKGEHFHIASDVPKMKGYNGYPLPKKDFPKQVEYIDTNKVNRIYPHWNEIKNKSNAGNYTLSVPVVGGGRSNNNTSVSKINNNNANMNGEELYKSLRGGKPLLNYESVKSKGNALEGANIVFNDVMKKAKTAEEKNALVNYFIEKGWFDNDGGGPLNDYRGKLFDEEFKKNKSQITDINKIMSDGTGVFGGFKTHISYDENGEVKSVSISELNIRELEKLGIKINGLDKIENSKTSEIGKSKETERVNSSNPEHSRYIIKGKGLEELRSQINKKIHNISGGDVDYFADSFHKNENGSYHFSPKNYDSKSREHIKIYPNTNGGTSLEEYGDSDSDSNSYSDVSGVGSQYSPVESNVNASNYKITAENIKTTVKLRNTSPITEEELKKAREVLGDKDEEILRQWVYENRLKQQQKDDQEGDLLKSNSEAAIEQMQRQVDNSFVYDKDAISKLDGLDKLLQGSLMGVIGITKGQDLAKTPLEMRDEMIGESYMDYTNELKKLSEIGLSVEEEAYAKRMLTESYQAGLDNIVRASGGNRNAVLGNLGRLDYQKQVGLMNLAMEDAKAKREALNKYGEATKYISEFEANKAIANNERKYQDSLLKRQAGAQLSREGFKSLVSSFNEYMDNKPGSINDIKKSHMLKTLYGYDPRIKDPNHPNSKEQYEKRMNDLSQKAERGRQIQNFINQLPEDQRYNVLKAMRERGIMSYTDNNMESLAQEFGYKTQSPTQEETPKYNFATQTFGINLNDYKLKTGYDGDKVSETTNENVAGNEQQQGKSNVLLDNYNPFNKKLDINVPGYVSSSSIFPDSADLLGTKEGFDFAKKDIHEYTGALSKENELLRQGGLKQIEKNNSLISNILDEEERIRNFAKETKKQLNLY